MRLLLCAAGLAAVFVAGISGAVTTASPAAAGCVNGVGCTEDGPLSYPALYDATCGELWYLRNSVYAENGYCFRSARGRKTFGNSGCSFRNAEDVILSRNERTNVARIREVERKRGCR